MTDQTRPSWDDAPEWAQWLAQDSTGEWYWYEEKPFWESEHGFYWSHGRDESAEMSVKRPGAICQRPNP